MRQGGKCARLTVYVESVQMAPRHSITRRGSNLPTAPYPPVAHSRRQRIAPPGDRPAIREGILG